MMSGGPNATLRQRLADVEREISDLKKQIRALPGGDTRIVALHLELRAARARRSRLRTAAKQAPDAGTMHLPTVLLTCALACAIIVALVLFDDVEPPDVERVDAKAAPARALDDTTTTSTTVVATTSTAAHAKRAEPTTTSSVDVATDGIEAQIVDGFARFGADVADQAVDVALCESGLDPSKTGAEGERGLLQIHGRYHMDRIHRLGFTWDQMYEVGPNIAVAVSLYADKGWGPWTCKPGGDR